MSELNQNERDVNEELVINADYVRRGIAQGMKGFFTPYKSLYEAITGKEQISIERDSRTGRFISGKRHRPHHQEKLRA